MNKVPRIGLAVLVALLVGSSAFGQAAFMGQYTSAKPLHQGKSLLGGYLGVFDDGVSGVGQYRYGIAEPFDGGLQFGVVNPDGPPDAGLLLGADGKYLLLANRLGDPFDLAVGGFFGLFAGDNASISLGANLIGSKDFSLQSGHRITPYGRFQLRVDQNGDADFNVGLSFGAELEVAPSTGIIGEMQLTDTVGFILGANFGL